MFLSVINLMKTYMLALCVAISFAVIKFIERKITSSTITPKDIIKNAITVYLSVYVGEFIVRQVAPIQLTKSPEVFVSEPGF